MGELEFREAFQTFVDATVKWILEAEKRFSEVRILPTNPSTTASKKPPETVTK